MVFTQRVNYVFGGMLMNIDQQVAALVQGTEYGDEELKQALDKIIEFISL